MGEDRRDVRTPGSRRAVPRAQRRGGAAALRLPRLPRCRLHAERGERSARAAGPWPAPRPARTRSADSRGDARTARRRRIADAGAHRRRPGRGAQVVLGLNAWAAGWPSFRTSLLAWGSHIVLTEPIPDRLTALGWVGGEGISDSRFTIHYFRTTADGRIAFGAGVGAAGYGGRIGTRFDHDERASQRARAGFARLFPMLADVRFVDAWGGPIDISSDRLPAIGSRAGGRLHFAHGYSGNGVGPAFLAGRILAARSMEEMTASPGCRLSTDGRRPSRQSRCATSARA